MTNPHQITTGKERAQEFSRKLEQAKSFIASALPKHVTADRLLTIALTEVRRTPDLLRCDFASLVGCIVQASQLGLEVGGLRGQAYLVPYKNVATLIIGYRGLEMLALRTGLFSHISSRVVYAEDEFSYQYGLLDKLVHEPTRGKRGELEAAYAIAHFKAGGHQFEVMEKEDVLAIKARARASHGPWVTDEAEMWRKTVTRRLCKHAPSSVEDARLHEAVAIDEAAERDEQQKFLPEWTEGLHKFDMGESGAGTNGTDQPKALDRVVQNRGGGKRGQQAQAEPAPQEEAPPSAAEERPQGGLPGVG